MKPNLNQATASTLVIAAAPVVMAHRLNTVDWLRRKF
jgi:hypothetical protein